MPDKSRHSAPTTTVACRCILSGAARAFCLTVLASCSGRSIPSDLEGGRVALAVRTAQAQHRVTAELLETDDDTGEGVDLTDALWKYSAITWRPYGLATSAAGRNNVYTWRPGQLIEQLSRRPPIREQRCSSAPLPSHGVNPTDVLLRLVTGSVTVGGVSVSTRSSDSEVGFVAGRDYLLLVETCPGNIALNAYGPYSVFPLGRNGTFVAAASSGRPFTEQVLQLGNVTGLRKRIRSLQIAPRQGIPGNR